MEEGRNNKIGENERRGYGNGEGRRERCGSRREGVGVGARIENG